MTIAALIGAKALWLTYLWLGSAIAGAWLTGRKGYAERLGLAAGLFLSVIGVVICLLLPAKAGSVWKTRGAFGRARL